MVDGVVYAFIVFACCCLSIVCFTGKTALLLAQSAEVVTALIDGKADVNATDESGTDIYAIFRPCFYLHNKFVNTHRYMDEQTGRLIFRKMNRCIDD